MVDRRRDDAGTRGRLHRWGRCPGTMGAGGPEAASVPMGAAAGPAGGLFYRGGLRGRRQADESLDGTDEDAVARRRSDPPQLATIRGPIDGCGYAGRSDGLAVPARSTLRRQDRPRRCGACGARNAAGRRAADQGDAGAAERSALRPLELDPRPLVVENRAQLGILCRGQIALRLQDEEVRRQPDLELALLGLKLFLGQLPRCRRGRDPIANRLDAKRGVGDLTGYPQLDAPNLSPVLLQSSRARSYAARSAFCPSG